MRSKITRRILDETPEDVKVFVDWYSDVVMLVKNIMEEKGYTQRDLAKKLDKSPSEISKWLKGEHNFTLRSLAKLQVELGEPILYIPKRTNFQMTSGKSFSMTVYSNNEKVINKDFIEGETYQTTSKILVA